FSPVKTNEKLSILTSVDDIKSSNVFHEHTVDDGIKSVELRDCHTTELEHSKHVRKQTSSLRPSVSTGGTFWDNHIEDHDTECRPNYSSHPDSVQKCGDGLNSRTPLCPSTVRHGRKRDHESEPTGPPPLGQHSSAEVSRLTKAAESISSSPEIRYEGHPFPSTVF
ncbi:hypothetical protein PHET_05147, partial [Paragonimus heterotremus]